MDFTNPFQTEDARKKAPGEIAQAWANFASPWLQMVGVSLSVQENDALATLIGAVLRSYPKLRDIKPQ